MRKLLFAFLLFTPLSSLAQENFYTLRGYVYSDDNEPLAGASVRVFNLNLGTTTDASGRYEIKLPDGFHRLTFTFLAHKPQTIELVMGKDDSKNIFLEKDTRQLQEFEVKLKRKDPAYDIIREVINKKEEIRNQYENYSAEVYIKGTELAQRKPKPAKTADEQLAKENESQLDKKPTPTADTLGNAAYFEAQLLRHEARPDLQKEERLAVKKYGDTRTIFFQHITDGEFSLYENLQKVPRLSQNSYISPISTLGLLSYKFKLLRSYYEGQRKVYVIRVQPRETGNALFDGEIEVLDGLFVLYRTRLALPSKTLIIYDEFGFEQQYQEVEKRWLPTTTRYAWKVKEGGTRRGETVVKQSKFEFNKSFPKRFFGVEKGITTDSAYKRDTSYWAGIRPEPLSRSEQRLLMYKDSVNRRLNSKEYLDSIDAVYNKITPLKVLWYGVGHINRPEKKDWFFAPLVSAIDPIAVGGLRVQYNVSFLKRFENRKSITINPFLSYGFLNQDFRGSLGLGYLYNPVRRSNLVARAGNAVGFINGAATIGDFFLRSNFYRETYGRLSHSTELVNGLYLTSDVNFARRYDLGDYTFPKRNPILPTTAPTRFPDSYRFITDFSLSYTPGQQYLREPNEKIILGSRYPTISVNLEQAWGLNTSWAKFTRIGAAVRQSFNVGMIGTSEYRVSAGSFLDTTRLSVMDYRYIRGGDRFFFSPPMYTFQLIPRTFTAFKWVYEGHYVHQFNGYLTSKIPFINKLGLQEMAGGGLLYVPERNYQYAEVFFGLNKILKMGRSRFRVGVYNVIGQSAAFGVRNQFKVSFEVYNRDRNTWSF